MKGRQIGALLLTLALSFSVWAENRRAIPVLSGTVRQPCVAITFDDGPKATTTSALLDGLAQRGAHATFFLVGLNIPGNEALIRRMAAEGHQVGVHSQNHRLLTDLSRAELTAEVEPVRQALTGLLGREQFMLRPPYGITDETLLSRVDMPVILWQVDPEDWSDRDSARQIDLILSQVEDGDIVLLHDIYPSSVDTALCVIDALMERGFAIVTVEELFALRGVTPEPGKIYRRIRP